MKLVLKPQKCLKGRCKMCSKSLNCLCLALLESCLLGFQLVSICHCGVLNHGDSFKYFPEIISVS